jgi:predicted MPP superfamily phosphohydrolase
LVSRRAVLKALVTFGAGSTALAGYALGIEPMWRLRVQTYRFTPLGWPKGFRLRAVLIADLHAGEPQMSVARIGEIVARANALEPDLHLLLGDFEAGHRWLTRRVPAAEWAAALSPLRAPLGVHAILGNHDWWDDHHAQLRRAGPVIGRVELEKRGIRVYENDAIRLTSRGQPFWLAGLADQLAIDRSYDASFKKLPQELRRGRRYSGLDDLPGTLAKIRDDAPVVLMAHEPDIFAQVPDRVAVTLSGHTHGGQVRLLGYSPVVPSRFGNRYAYGHVVEEGRHLVVSGGLGCSIMPVRLGVPPEIVLLELGAQPT